MDLTEKGSVPPTDRFNLVYLTLVLHGAGTLMPWNMFITPKSYFVEYKLANATSGDFHYDSNFLSSVTLVAEIPCVLFNWINIFVQFGGNLTTRIVGSILVMIAVFILTVVLAMVDSSEWPAAFFWITMISVVLLNMAGGAYQNTVYGIGAKLPPEYTGAIVLGSNISGTVAAVMSFLTLFIASSVQTAAIYFFLTGLVFLVACLDTYFALPLNRFYRYNDQVSRKELERKKEENAGVPPRPPYWAVLRQCYPQCINVFLVYFVTLSLFPTVQSGIEKSDPNFFISDDYYDSIMCYVTWNACAMIGSFMATWIRWPGPKYLIVAVCLRFVFIPLYILCNYQPDGGTRAFSVLINNDYAYWIIGAVMGITSGHFGSLSMMYCPRNVEPKYQQVAGMFGAAFLVSGIICGILFSYIIIWFVENA